MYTEFNFPTITITDAEGEVYKDFRSRKSIKIYRLEIDVVTIEDLLHDGAQLHLILCNTNLGAGTNVYSYTTPGVCLIKRFMLGGAIATGLTVVQVPFVIENFPSFLLPEGKLYLKLLTSGTGEAVTINVKCWCDVKNNT